MSDELKSILLGLSAIYIVAIIALILTILNYNIKFEQEKLDRILKIFLAGIVIQSFHFIEEFLTGFHILYPQFLGLSPWSSEFFVGFNLSWIIIWLVSVIGIRHYFQPAFFPLWFFAIGMTLNLVAHPLLAIANNGYFPGLTTSPFVGIFGIVLLQKLNDAKN